MSLEPKGFITNDILKIRFSEMELQSRHSELLGIHTLGIQTERIYNVPYNTEILGQSAGFLPLVHV